MTASVFLGIGIALALSGVCHAGASNHKPMTMGMMPPAVFPTQGCLTDRGWREYDGHCYKLVSPWTSSGGTPFTMASAHCKEFGPSVDGGTIDIAHLADIHSMAENEFVAEIVAEGNRAWLGMTRGTSGAFYWMNESTLQGSEITAESFTNWKNNEPNNNGEEEDCVEINRGQPGKWNDIKCRRNLHAVCKYNIARFSAGAGKG